MKKLYLILTALVMLVSLSVSAAKKTDVTIKVNGQNRSMIVYTPNTLSKDCSLIIVTHGMGQDPVYQSVGTAPNYDGGDRLWEMCDTAKIVVAYLRSDGNMWDTGGTKDIDFVNQTIDEMYTKYAINKNRVYWSGFSMGSMLIYATIAMINSNAKAKNLVNRIAAFAPTSGYQFGATPWKALTDTKKKINLIHHHSESDNCFYWDGHNQQGVKPLDYITKVAEANGGTYAKISYKSKEGNYTGTKEIWSNTSTGNVIEFFHYTQGGHWPSWYNRKEIWSFCRRFSLATPLEEYEKTYKSAKELADTWADVSTITAKTQYKNLITALETYAPEKIDKSDDSALKTATSNLSSKMSLLETETAKYKPNGKLAAQPTEFDPNFHIYLCFGQSNMEGNAAIEAQDLMNVDPRFRMMAAVSMSGMTRVRDYWYTAYPPLCRQENGLTPADYFGREMVANLPDSISVGVINVAVGGASIKLFDQDVCKAYIAGEADWFKNYCKNYNNDPYKRLVDCAKKAQKVGVIKGILLHQGCTDNGQVDWPVRVKRVYTRLLNDLGLEESETPLLVGELLQQKVGGICYGHNNVIAKIATTIPNAHVISSEGCPGAADGLHFTAEGYRMIGKRYAEKMLTLLDQKKEIDFDTTETYFPLNTTAFNSSLCKFGTVSKTKYYLNVKSGGTDGYSGWRYSKGIDLSQYKYLVFSLYAKTSGTDAKIKIFDTDDYMNPCYSVDFGTKKQVAVDLQNMTDANGNKIDPSHLYLIGISSNGTKSVYLSDVFLSDDGETATEVDGVPLNLENAEKVVFDMTGRRVLNPTSGIYIINGKKTLVK